MSTAAIDTVAPRHNGKNPGPGRPMWPRSSSMACHAKNKPTAPSMPATKASPMRGHTARGRRLPAAAGDGERAGRAGPASSVRFLSPGANSFSSARAGGCPSAGVSLGPSGIETACAAGGSRPASADELPPMLQRTTDGMRRQLLLLQSEIGHELCELLIIVGDQPAELVCRKISRRIPNGLPGVLERLRIDRSPDRVL